MNGGGLLGPVDAWGGHRVEMSGSLLMLVMLFVRVKLSPPFVVVSLLCFLVAASCCLFNIFSLFHCTCFFV